MSEHPSDPKEAAQRLLAYLRKLKNDRGAMADLRCALSPARLARAWPLLASVNGIGNRRIETIAGLFAGGAYITFFVMCATPNRPLRQHDLPAEPEHAASGAYMPLFGMCDHGSG